MSAIRTILVAVAVLAPAHEASAQMFKCTDAAGKVTYSSTTCKELGLKDAGAVPDRIQVTPAPVNQPAPGTPQRPPSAARQEPTAEKPAATAEPVKEPERRCFRVAGGGIRCNDKPDE